MPLPPIREFKLAGPEGDGRHPYVNNSGAFLGEGTPLLEKDALGRWQPRKRQALEWLLSKGYGQRIDLESRMRGLSSVARALNGGDQSLASIALVLMELPPLPDAESASRMSEADTVLANYNPHWADEPRVGAGNHDGGQWTTDGSAAEAASANEEGDHGTGPRSDRLIEFGNEDATRASDFTNVAYSGAYHNQVVNHFADIFRSQNVPVETNVPLTTLDGRFTAVADIIIKNPQTGLLFLLEVKTGDDPTYTFNQRVVYPMASIGGHVFSNSPKILTFGFPPGVVLPPMEVDQVYAVPGRELRVDPLPPEFLKFAKLFLSMPGSYSSFRENCP